MNEIIKNIEAAQLKASVPEFAVGDTVKVYNKIKEPPKGICTDRNIGTWKVPDVERIRTMKQ